MPEAIRTSLLPFWPESGHKTSIYHSIIMCSTPKIRGTCYKNTDGVLLIIPVVDKCMLMITRKGWFKRTILKRLQSFQLERGGTGGELSLILPHFFHHPLTSFLTLGGCQACVWNAVVHTPKPVHTNFLFLHLKVWVLPIRTQCNKIWLVASLVYKACEASAQIHDPQKMWDNKCVLF